MTDHPCYSSVTNQLKDLKSKKQKHTKKVFFLFSIFKIANIKINNINLYYQKINEHYID